MSGDTFDEVRELLEEQFYEPVIIRDLKSFCVVYPKYTEHPSLSFKVSVLQRSKGSHHLFFIKDQLSISSPCLIHLVRYAQRSIRRVELLHPFVDIEKSTNSDCCIMLTYSNTYLRYPRSPT